jgi:hypothetical protein
MISGLPLRGLVIDERLRTTTGMETNGFHRVPPLTLGTAPWVS